ncbi:hypothetical protein EON66_03545, partial [archaeon]
MCVRAFVRACVHAHSVAGIVFFHLTDPTASYGFDDFGALLRATVSGDASSFCKHAGIPSQALVYESPAAEIGIPKHFVVLDEASKSVVLAIRGTMSLNDALTDLVARHVDFCDGEAHEGIAHGAHAIYHSVLDVLQRELQLRPGWSLVVTGHSLGAATAILFTILLHYHRRKHVTDRHMAKELVPFYNVDIKCFACTCLDCRARRFAPSSCASRACARARPATHCSRSADPFCSRAVAPPPVFGPLSALPDDVVASITSWVHNEDIVSRLSLGSVRDLVRILRKITVHEPSLGRRIFSDVDLQAVLDTEPEWLRAWTGRASAAASGARGEEEVQAGGDHGPAVTVDAAGTRTGAGTTSAAAAAGAGAHGEGSDTTPAFGTLPAQRSEDGAHAAAQSASAGFVPPRPQVQRLHIPGVIYCFRAPVDVGAADALEDASRSSSSALPRAPSAAASGADIPAHPDASGSPLSDGRSEGHAADTATSQGVVSMETPAGVRVPMLRSLLHAAGIARQDSVSNTRAAASTAGPTHKQAEIAVEGSAAHAPAPTHTATDAPPFPTFTTAPAANFPPASRAAFNTAVRDAVDASHSDSELYPPRMKTFHTVREQGTRAAAAAATKVSASATAAASGATQVASTVSGLAAATVSSVSSAIGSLWSAITTTPPAGNEAAGAGADVCAAPSSVARSGVDSATDDVQLNPGVALEAAARAQAETLPFVT